MQGIYLIHLEGPVQQLALGKLSVLPFQDLKITSSTNGSSTITFSEAPTVANQATMSISGPIIISSNIVVKSAMYSSNAGTVKFVGVTTTSSSGSKTLALNGELPGTLTCKPHDGSAFTISRNDWNKPSMDNFFSWTAEVEAVWSSGSALNRNGRPFQLFRMKATSGFNHNLASADKYKSICMKAGLRTVGSGYGNYVANCRNWNCLPVGCSGNCPGKSEGSWGSTSDVDDQIRSKTSWSVNLLIHHYGNGYPYGYNDCNSQGSSCWNQQYYPICGLEH